MEKVKICHFVSGLKSGGVEQMIYNYCSNFDLSKFDFFIVYQHEPDLKKINEFKKLNFKLIRISSKFKHPIKNFVETYKILKNNNFDVVHCHMTLMNFIPLIISKKLKVKVRICHSHNNDIRKKFFLIRFIEKVLKKICIRCSTEYLACGEDAGKYMYNNIPFTIINNALDLDKFKFSEENRKMIRGNFNIKDDEIVIGHIGRFTNQKNHNFIIDLFEQLIKINNKYRLLLIGDGELKTEIENKVKEKKMENKINFVGVVSNTYLYYSCFDIFILPSIWEGLPVVAIEAQAAGLKCIFSNNIDSKVGLSGNVEFLSISNKDDWINAILKYKSNYIRVDNSNILSKNGYDIKKEYKTLMNIYLDIR